MAKALTPKTVENILSDPARRMEIPDPGLSGLYLVVQPSGSKSWALRYRFGGKPAKLTLGLWPMMGVADARTAATTALTKVERGADPAAEKKATKAARQEAILTERDKVKTLVNEFEKRHLSALKSGASARQFFDRHVLPAWRERDIATITKRDVIELLDGLMDRGLAVTANRVRAHLSSFFNWLVGRDVIAASPMTGVKPPAKETSRDRVLSDDEIRWLWIACDKTGEPWGPLAKLLLLTGQRLSEVAQMTEDELDGNVWHLPASRTKNGRPHSVPLADAASAVLRVKVRVQNPSGYVFCTNGQSAVSGFSKAHSQLVKAMTEAANEGRSEPLKIEPWTFHDLRRTCATGLARLGIPVRTTEAVLNHVSGTASGIVSVYQRHDYADEKRAALEAWGRYVLSLQSPQAGNVVRLEARA